MRNGQPEPARAESRRDAADRRDLARTTGSWVYDLGIASKLAYIRFCIKAVSNMLVKKAMQLVLMAWALQPGEAATAASVKLCGRRLSEIMSRVCHVYNSPSWTDDNPTVVEQPGARRKRQVGIADQCCTFGCTWEQLNEYCAISNSESTPLSELTSHGISEAGSTEHKRAAEAQPQETPPEVGRRSRGYGRRRRRCWCRRKRRSGRRRTLMGNMVHETINDRPDPVFGTVSPVLTWGRTLNTDLPPMERDRYNYIAVYS